MAKEKKRAEEAPTMPVAEEEPVPKAPAQPVTIEGDARMREYARRRKLAGNLRAAASRVMAAPFRGDFAQALDQLCRERLEG